MAAPPCWPLCLAGCVGIVLLGAGPVVTFPGQGSFPGCEGSPLLSTLETQSGPGWALSNLLPARLTAMWQGRPASPGGPSGQTAHMSGPPRRERGCCLQVSELESETDAECCDVLQGQIQRGCSPAAWSQVPHIFPFSGAGSPGRRASLGAGQGTGLGWDALLSPGPLVTIVFFTELPEWVNSTQRGGCLSGLWERLWQSLTVALSCWPGSPGGIPRSWRGMASFGQPRRKPLLLVP